MKKMFGMFLILSLIFVFNGKGYASEANIKFVEKYSEDEILHLTTEIGQSFTTAIQNDFTHLDSQTRTQIYKKLNSSYFQGYMKRKIVIMIKSIPREQFNNETIGFTEETQAKFKTLEDKLKKKLLKSVFTN